MAEWMESDKKNKAGWRSRFRRRSDVPDTMSEQPTESARWQTAFLIAGSALLGATAIAFWNRRTIAGLRARLAAEGSKRSPQSNDEII